MKLTRVAAAAATAMTALALAVAGPLGLGTANADVPPDHAWIIPEPALSGANDFTCRPTAAKPNPVVLVHGLGATASENWYFLAPYLAGQGYCVFAKTYGMDPRYPSRGGLKPMNESAAELSAFVDEVLAATGARKVDIVGYSEGAIMPRWYLKFLGGAAKVDHFVGWAGPNHGTNIHGITDLRTAVPGWDGHLGQYCGSCPQFMPGSDFLTALNADDETPGTVHYTVIATKYDELVTPYQTSFLTGAENIALQDVDPANYAGHASMANDPTTFALTLKALAAHGH
ncbi:alpha/beta fold hydrolase [Sporichthya sp.]|uniref:esterase/lipase family protein n=1 Tax=Sporichthya sp. TaxID=65475 RepID=UPI00183834FF|nr:alpha/beta fold hydrolase [Sporichthya sp.]MBA3742745.1 alpha/beta fold hydrolase [Sporichthya sp.]